MGGVFSLAGHTPFHRKSPELLGQHHLLHYLLLVNEYCTLGGLCCRTQAAVTPERSVANGTVYWEAGTYLHVYTFLYP